MSDVWKGWDAPRPDWSGSEPSGPFTEEQRDLSLARRVSSDPTSPTNVNATLARLLYVRGEVKAKRLSEFPKGESSGQ